MKKPRKKKHKGRNYHHLKPQSRGGKYTDDNLLLIYANRHKVWHTLFGNRTLDEVINLLIRLRKLKGEVRWRIKRSQSVSDCQSL